MTIALRIGGFLIPALLLASGAARAQEEASARSEALAAKGDFAGALEAAEKALERDPEEPRGMLLRAEALEGLGRRGEADAAFREAYTASLAESGVHDRARDGIVRLLHARALEEEGKGDLAAALSCAVEALIFDTEDIEGILLRGRLLEDLGRREEAEEEFRNALEKGPSDPRALEEAARFFLRARRNAEALPLLERRIASDGNGSPRGLSWAHFNAARIRVEEGKRGAALVHLRAAAALTPDDPDVRAVLADLEAFRTQADRIARAEKRLVAGILAILAAYAGVGAFAWRRLGRRSVGTGS
jgi:tetratricopeptide (TPR) repeat protein